jgi:hypothetical protein
MLGKAESDLQKDWCELLPYVMAAYLTSKHDRMGFSPNFLTFGREVRAPVDLVLGRPEEQSVNTDGFI